MTPARSLAAGVFLSLALTLAAALTNQGFPPVNTDEAILSNHAYNLYHGNTNRYSLYDDLFDRELAVWRNAAAGVLQIVYEAWIGPFVAWPEKSLSTARRASLLAGFLTLFLWFLIGRASGGPWTGYAAVALGWAFPFFQLAISLVRAEIVLLLASSFTIYLCLRVPEELRWKYPALGALCGLWLGIHQNAVPFFLGFLLFAIVRDSHFTRLRRALVLTGAFLVGTGTIFCLINVVDFWRSQQLIVYELYRPPVLAWPWNPAAWAIKWCRHMFTGLPTWYLPGATGNWSWSAGLFWLALLLPCLTRKKPAPILLAFAAGAAGVFTGLCLLIKKDEAIYTVMLLPFLLPFCAAALAEGLRKKSAVSFAALTALMGSLYMFAHFRASYRATYPPYTQMTNDLKAMLPENARVAAPNIFWFAFPEDNFRDISALVGSRWVTGGRRDVRNWLSGWKPDVIVVEPSWKRMLLGPEDDTLVLLQSHLGKNVTHLGDLDTGAAVVGKVEVFQIRW